MDMNNEKLQRFIDAVNDETERNQRNLPVDISIQETRKMITAICVAYQKLNLI